MSEEITINLNEQNEEINFMLTDQSEEITVNLNQPTEEIKFALTDQNEEVVFSFSEAARGATGPAGATGPTGPTGAPGSSTTAWHYRAKTTIITGNPTDGHLIWNNATQISATSINVSHKNQDGDDIELILGFIQKGQDLFIQNRDASEDFQVWKISGIPTLTGGGTANAYFTYPVTLVNSGGNGTTGFANNHQLLFGTTQTLPLHASTHASGGTDPITPSSIGAAPLDSPSFTGQLSVTSPSGAFNAVTGIAPGGTGIQGNSITGTGVSGDSDSGDGIYAYSNTGSGGKFVTSSGVAGNFFSFGGNFAQFDSADEGIVATIDYGGNITTNGYIQSRSTFKLFNGTYTTTLSHSPTANRAIAFPNKAGTVAMTSDITGTNSGTNTGDETGARIASLITAATSKTTPVDADEIPITDSAASFGLKKLTFANLKTALNTLYVALTGNQTIAGNKTFSGQTELTGQAATNGTSAMTRDLSDTRSGVIYYLIDTSEPSSSSTAYVNSSQTLVIPAGTYVYEGSLFAYTASATGGLNCNVTGLTSTSRQHNISIYRSTSTSTSFYQLDNPAEGTRALRTELDTDIFGAIFFDAGTTRQGISMYHGYFVTSATRTLRFRISQRTATDAVNPAVLKQAYLKLTKIA